MSIRIQACSAATVGVAFTSRTIFTSLPAVPVRRAMCRPEGGGLGLGFRARANLDPSQIGLPRSVPYRHGWSTRCAVTLNVV
jgi:hypothetical protein